MQIDPTRTQPVHFDPKDRPLRRDVGWLGGLLGSVLREVAPEGVYETVEAARLAARRRRRGDISAGQELEGLLGSLAPGRALEVVRAFSAYFGVVNMAEQVHRLRRRLDYARADEAQPGSLRAAAEALVARGVTAKEVEAALEGLLVEPVFTAHPTEAVRRSLLKKDQRLARALVARFELEHLDRATRERLEEQVALEVASAWQTEEQLPGRPTVADEVEHALFFVSDVLYRVVPTLHEELARELARAFHTVIPVRRPVVRFASWVGGDMDGNPNVGADTIRATLRRHMELAVRRTLEELRGLHEHLSQSLSRVTVDDALLALVREYAARFVAESEAVPERYAGMPYRQLLWLMTARLEHKRDGRPGGYGPPEELLADLRVIETSLERNGGARAGLALVRRTLRRVEVFGFHLAALDTRQDAEVHRRAVGELLGVEDFSAQPAAERTERLARALAAGTAPSTAPRTAASTGGVSDETLRTVEVFRALSEALAAYGPRALGPAIISMAQGPDDALAVLYLARAGGCITADGVVPLDIAPLFETVDDLEAGPGVLRALAADSTYAAHLTARGKRQVVMLGYSDSNKDGGIVASRVALDRAQSELVAVAEALGLKLQLFHGRGGSVSRGGSKPRAGILAAPRGALAGGVRTTEQGEIIANKFGLRGIAIRTLEVSLGALLERTAGGDRAPETSAEQHALRELLTTASRAKYRALVHDDPDFTELFQGMTPIDIIERLQIGSRPARRREMRGVQDLRAIPWVFAWTQCRALLTGWFGVGAGLAAARAEVGLEGLRSAARDWPFFGTLLDDVEMVLAKSDLDIAARYAALAGPVGARLFPALAAEHASAVEQLLEVRGTVKLLERDPGLQRSIRLRNPYVDTMSFVQIDLLRRWRDGGREDPELERVLVQTVRGIARGLRNTG